MYLPGQPKLILPPRFVADLWCSRGAVSDLVEGFKIPKLENVLETKCV